VDKKRPEECKGLSEFPTLLCRHPPKNLQIKRGVPQNLKEGVVRESDLDQAVMGARIPVGQREQTAE